MLRLFISIPLPNDIKYEILNINHAVNYASNVSFENLHITIKFLGNLKTDQYFSIRKTIELLEIDKFKLKLQSVGHFTKGNSKAIWVGVLLSDELRALKNTLDSQLDEFDIQPSRKKFRPHITIARFKTAKMEELEKFYLLNSSFTTKEFEVKSMQLMSSKLYSDGPIYQIESNCDFK